MFMAMRRFFLHTGPLTVLFTIVALSLGVAAGAAQEATEPEIRPLEPVKTRSERLDGYFVELKREAEPASARQIADRIWAEWRKSDSATANQLMDWANDAIRDKRYYTALDLLDQITVLTPTLQRDGTAAPRCTT